MCCNRAALARCIRPSSAQWAKTLVAAPYPVQILTAELSRETDLATGLCDAVPSQDDLGVPDARLVAPGDPDRSILWLRVRSLAPERMPPISKNVVDEVGAELLRSWIASLERCD